jgi:hypothetical protein
VLRKEKEESFCMGSRKEKRRNFLFYAANRERTRE